MTITSITFAGLTGFTTGLELSSIGNLTTFVGPNASGKTTALQAVASLLTFLSEKSFDSPARVKKGDWLYWESATIRFKLDEPTLDPIGRLTVSFALHVAHQDSMLRIIGIDSDDSSLTLDEQVLHRPNPETETIRSEIKKLEASVHAERSNIPTLSRPPVNQAATQQHQENLNKWETKLTQQKVALEGALKELLAFHDEQGQDTTVSRGAFTTLLAGLGVSARLLEARKNPSESIERLLDAMVASKKGRDTEHYNDLKGQLSELLQASADVHEDTAKHFTVDGVEHTQLSNGTQVCLYYFSLVFDLPPNTTLLWDEPENGLHSTRRHKLLEMLRRDGRQVFVATHATEFTPVLSEDCEVFLFRGGVYKKLLALTAERVSGRRGGFEVAESLGIHAARTLFTAHVVIWVEGPSDAVFWRHWLHTEKRLVDGFDYTIMVYGGGLIAHLDVVEEVEDRTRAFDLLSLCRHPLVIVDLDTDAEEQELKPHATRLRQAIDKINEHVPRRGMFMHTGGREVENYLPSRAIQHAVETLGAYDKPTRETLALQSFALAKHDRYYEALGRHFKERQVVSAEGTPRNVSKWGEKAKVSFMGEALRTPSLQRTELLHGGAGAVSAVVDWVTDRRVGGPRE